MRERNLAILAAGHVIMLTFDEVLQVLSPSKDSTAWDHKDVAFPCAVPMEDGSCRLYYSCSDAHTPGKSGVGMAVSDGTDWTRFTRFSPLSPRKGAQLF